MISMHSKTVNVNRTLLLQKLKSSLATHQQEYKEALVAFHTRLTEDLKLAHKKISKVTDVEQLKDFEFSADFPQNHEEDYLNVIEMLEMSVDENIQLDQASFKAYVKNDWPWKQQFVAASSSYAIAGSSMKNFNG
jgi:hypothetical protein